MQVFKKKRNPFLKHIFDSKIQKSLEKPPKLDNYDGLGNLDENIEHVDTILDYYHI